MQTLSPHAQTDQRYAPGSERRKNPRVDCALIASRSSADGFFVDERITNISRSGLFLLTPESLHVGDRLELFIQVPGERHELAMQADVIQQRGSGVGLYLSFVEPSQKALLQKFIDSLLGSLLGPGRAVKAQPRIRVMLEPQVSAGQLQSLEDLTGRGLFIEVPQPMSVFEEPRVRFVNPVTQEIYDLSGKIVHAQVLETVPGEATRYGIGVRFETLSATDRQALERMITSISPAPRPRKVPNC